MDVPSYLLGKQAGGGGASYTAGTNIEITNDNVINNTIPYTYNAAFNNNGIALGPNTSIPNGASSTVLIGYNANLSNNANGSVVVGNSASANRSASVVIGSGAQAQQWYSTVIGGHAKDNNIANTIVIGAYAHPSKSNQAIFGSTMCPIDEATIYTSNGEKALATTDYLTTITGYDATKTQVLKNVNGTFTWVDE